MHLEHLLGHTLRPKTRARKREQHTRAGYVYVISNIGSFGSDVYKIGVTRRLEPEERVVQQNFNKPVEFRLLAQAEQYRESEARRKSEVEPVRPKD